MAFISVFGVGRLFYVSTDCPQWQQFIPMWSAHSVKEWCKALSTMRPAVYAATSPEEH